MSLFYQNDFKLGILGGGQLGRMLIQEACNLNINCHVLDPDVNAPCATICDVFVNGSFNDYNNVMNFGSDKDVVTIEIEHVNLQALFDLEKKGIKVYPKPNVLQVVKDKGNQKLFYKENNIPTADFYLINNKSEIQKHIAEFPFMQKLRCGGYDGKGVQLLDNEGDISKAFDQPSVLEKKIDFEREISVIVARNVSNEVSAFPVVDMEFNKNANLVEFLFSPSELEMNIQLKAIEIAKTLIVKLDHIGILAVEMFVTKNGSLLVNEIAPRPHNSGHQTIEGNSISQYAQHIRAILNLPLGNTNITQPSVMVNLLGEPGFTGEAFYENLDQVLNIPGCYVHLYGKKITKPFRKMGHITIVNESLDKAKQIAQKVKEIVKVKSK